MFSRKAKTRSNIQEANKHLQALYERVSELENTTAVQADEFAKKECEFNSALRLLSETKDGEINELRTRLDASLKENRQLTHELSERNTLISHLQSRCQVLDDIIKFQPVLRDLLTTMGMQKDVASQGTRHEKDVIPANTSISNCSLDGVGIDDKKAGMSCVSEGSLGIESSKGSVQASTEELHREVASVRSSVNEDRASSISPSNSGFESNLEKALSSFVEGLVGNAIIHDQQVPISRKKDSVTSLSFDGKIITTTKESNDTGATPIDINKCVKQSNGVQADDSSSESEEETEQCGENELNGLEESPTIQQMTKQYSNNPRHFSISDEENHIAPDKDSVFHKMKKNKEIYL